MQPCWFVLTPIFPLGHAVLYYCYFLNSSGLRADLSVLQHGSCWGGSLFESIDHPFDWSSASDGCEHLALEPAILVALVQFHWFATYFCDLRQAHPGDFPPVQGDLSGWWNSSAGYTAAYSHHSPEWRLFLASVHGSHVSKAAGSVS